MIRELTQDETEVVAGGNGALYPTSPWIQPSPVVMGAIARSSIHGQLGDSAGEAMYEGS